MANPEPTSTRIVHSPGTENLRANQSTPPSKIPSGRGGSGSAPRGLKVGDCRQDATSLPSGRGAKGSAPRGLVLSDCRQEPTALPTGRGPAGSPPRGLTVKDAKQLPSRYPGK